MKPKVFGKRPILMQRWEGGLRIIHIDGRVEWASSDGLHDFADADGCTSRDSQREAYEACIKYDRFYSNPNYSPKIAFSTFLGYL